MNIQSIHQSDSTYDVGMNSGGPGSVIDNSKLISRRAQDYRLTFHALKRMQQRDIALNDIEQIIKNGRIIYLRNRIGFRLNLVNVQNKGTNFQEIERSLDAVVIVNPNEKIIITVRPYGSNIHNHRKCKKRFNIGNLHLDFEHPSEVLFSFESAQKLESIDISFQDIKRLVQQGCRTFNSNTLSLFRPSRFYFDINQDPHIKGITMIIDRKNATVVNFSKSDQFRFLISWISSIHHSRSNPDFLKNNTFA